MVILSNYKETSLSTFFSCSPSRITRSSFIILRANIRQSFINQQHPPLVSWILFLHYLRLDVDIQKIMHTFLIDSNPFIHELSLLDDNFYIDFKPNLIRLNTHFNNFGIVHSPKHICTLFFA